MESGFLFGYFCFRLNFCPMVHSDFVLVGCMGILQFFRSWLTSGVAHVDIMLSILTSTPKPFTIIDLGTPGHEGA